MATLKRSLAAAEGRFFGEGGQLCEVPRKKQSKTIYLTPRQFAMLKALASVTRIPFSELVREAVDAVLEQVASRERRGSAVQVRPFIGEYDGDLFD